MRIGILTYHRSHNYGAVLQAYALKIYLRSIGHNVEIIDYWPDYRNGMYDLFDFSFFNEKISNFSKFKKIIRQILYFFPKYIRYRKFQSFIIENFELDNRTKISKGENIPNRYDIYIYGSDQIWRNNNLKSFQGFDPVYWGKFPLNAQGNKIAYGASMGEINYKGEEKFISEHLNFFSSISVREADLKKVIIGFTKKDVKQVLDPVFLIEQKKWYKLIDSKHITKKKYLLFYHLNYSKSAKEFVEKIAKFRNLKVIEIKGGVRFFVNPLRVNQYAGPTEYVKLFRDASFVISTSFHGVAFSIIFKKQFYALGMGRNSERVTSLLEKLDIKGRYLKEEVVKLHDIQDLSDEKIDFVAVYKSLAIFKKQSVEFIENALSCLSSGQN